MNLHFIKLILALPLALAGCQTVPPPEGRATFSAPTSDHNGQIRISAFHIPKDEHGVKLFFILAAVGGADTNRPFGGSVFDISGETRYLGDLHSGIRAFRRPWIEYETPVGKRTLMLVEPATHHVDFIEIEVKPGGVSHIALSQYGFLRLPYLGEVLMSDVNRKYCESLTGKPSEREKSAISYMAANGIDSNARDFERFCRLLSDPKYIVTPMAETKEYLKLKPQIEKLRAEHYEKWKSEAEKRAPYDLMRSYQPVNAQEP